MKKYVLMILRFILGLVFLFACWDKILHPKAFAEVVYNYQILPGPLINFTSMVLPVLELFMAVCLIFGIWLPGTLFLANVLLAVFFSALIFNLVRGLDVHCGCFSTDGSGEKQVSMAGYIFRDLVFMAIALFLMFRHYRDSRSLGRVRF